jgi:hypothetical protein
MSDELLPRVDLFRISGPMLEALTDLVRQAVRQEMAAAAPAGALRAADAARYLGLGRSKFYVMLKADPELMGASFCVGTARLWSREALDGWMRTKQDIDANTVSPK